MKDLLNYAIDILNDSGVAYGDIRIGFYTWQHLTTRNDMVTNISETMSEGFGIRVMHNGGWGFASSPELTKASIARQVKKAIDIATASAITRVTEPSFTKEQPQRIYFVTPHELDPFSVPIQEKIDLLIDINMNLLKVPGVKRGTSSMSFSREHKFFENTEGSYYEQDLFRVNAGYTAMAVGPQGFESRTFPWIPLNAGYEHIISTPYRDYIRQTAEEAVMKLKARDCPCEVTDLILLPSHTALTIHETIGHATELDRVMGWEADMAGTSFATIDKLNRLKYGSDIFNVVADRTMEKGRATAAMDDEGVVTGRWHLIRNGILTGYATTRSTAGIIGENRSRGCSYADNWKSVPILRMANVSIEPGGPGSPTLEELIADTRDGVLVDGMGSFSIDHQRINFQFGGDFVWKIHNGKKVEPLRRFTYQSHNPVFWNSVDAICNESEWKPYGVVNCGKGQPMQVAQLTHGSAPLRLKNITIGKAKI